MSHKAVCQTETLFSLDAIGSLLEDIERISDSEHGSTRSLLLRLLCIGGYTPTVNDIMLMRHRSRPCFWWLAYMMVAGRDYAKNQVEPTDTVFSIGTADCWLRTPEHRSYTSAGALAIALCADRRSQWRLCCIWYLYPTLTPAGALIPSSMK